MLRAMIPLALLSGAVSVFAGHVYQIEVTADPAHDKLIGTEHLTYRNDSGKRLDELPLRGIAVIKRVTDASGRELSHTDASVRLADPLDSGGEVVLTFDFEAPFGVGGSGYRLATGAWHPKAQVFRKGAFNSRQQQADDYDLRLTAPAGEIPALAGKRLEQVKLPDGSRRLHTSLRNATGLGIAMSPEFTETVRTVDGVEIRAYTLPRGREWGPKLADLATDIVAFYNKLAGFYPHPWLVILPGNAQSRGGYPAATGMVAIHNLEGTEPDFATWITAHEIGHQYWGFDTVIDDADYYGWPGLGLGLWMDRQYMEASGLGRKEHDSLLNDNYLPAVYKGNDTTLRRAWPEIRKLNFDFNNAVAHGKGYTVIQMLEELMTPVRFRQFALKLLNEYRFRFLSHQDFEDAAAKAYGAPLDWFFRDWLDSDRKLGYEISNVKHDGGTATVTIRHTGDAALPLPLEVKTADGLAHRMRLSRARGEQILSLKTQARPVFAAIDPDHRFPLYSPDARHIWGKKVEVAEVRWPESIAWGTNQAQLILRNSDDKAHHINLQIQTSTGMGGVGWDTEHLIEPGQEQRIDRDFVLKPFPGAYSVRVQARDLETGILLKWEKTTGEFTPGNERLASLRLPEKIRSMFEAKRVAYARLRMLAGDDVFLYYPEDDPWLDKHAADLLAERESYLQDIRTRINPSYSGKVTVIFFPDEDSKRAWTGHIGMGWAIQNVLVEVRNAKQSMDPAHELVHVLADPLGTPPAMLGEGLAVYFQKGQVWEGYHVDAWCKAFASAGMLWPIVRIGSLDDIGPEGTQPAVTYPQAASVVKFLIERAGFDNFMAGYRALGDPNNRGREAALAAFRKHFGMDPITLEREWRLALDKSGVAPVPEDSIARVRAELQSTAK